MVAAVVLAAGKSERMGSNKLLLKVAGRTILDWLLDALDASVVNEVFVVLGHKPDDLRPIAEAHVVETVLNPNFEEGMTSSFKAGLRCVSADAVFLLIGDQIGLEGKLLDRMVLEMEKNSEAMIVSPICGNRRGHPVLLRRHLFHEILKLEPGASVRDVLLLYEDAHRTVEGNEFCVLDIDTPEDFERARRLYEASLDIAP